MNLNRKDLICALLKSIETGNTEAVSVVNEDKYIQHNPQTQVGSEGLAALFKRLSKTSPRVNIVRIFEDADFVFAHTEYDFSKSNIGFEIFRFDQDQAIEHWDNIQPRLGPNASGHSMVDGETRVIDLDKTENNREIARAFIQEILINLKIDSLRKFVDEKTFIEHNPSLTDGISSLETMLQNSFIKNAEFKYLKIHRVLAEGNFVLCVSEGYRNSNDTSFFDLFRVEDGKIVEHWDTTETIPPRSQWKNNNGKF